MSSLSGCWFLDTLSQIHVAEGCDLSRCSWELMFWQIFSDGLGVKQEWILLSHHFPNMQVTKMCRLCIVYKLQHEITLAKQLLSLLSP